MKVGIIQFELLGHLPPTAWWTIEWFQKEHATVATYLAAIWRRPVKYPSRNQTIPWLILRAPIHAELKWSHEAWPPDLFWRLSRQASIAVDKSLRLGWQCAIAHRLRGTLFLTSAVSLVMTRLFTVRRQITETEGIRVHYDASIYKKTTVQRWLRILKIKYTNDFQNSQFHTKIQRDRCI